MGAIVSKTITGANQWTEAIQPDWRNNLETYGKLNVSIAFVGTAVATVSIQRKLPDAEVKNDWGPSEWNTIQTYNASEETTITDVEVGTQYRIGVVTGDYTSGSVKARLSR